MANTQKDVGIITGLQAVLASHSTYTGRLDGLFGTGCRKAFEYLINKAFPEVDINKLPGNTYQANSVYTYIQTGLATTGLYTFKVDGFWGFRSQNAFDTLVMKATGKEEEDPNTGKDFPIRLTADQLAGMLPLGSGALINRYLYPLNETFDIFEINTPLRIAHFMAQILHETGNFKYTEEIASGKAYEGRSDLGNTRPGDGVLFKGRGLLQITGRSNYEKCQDYLRKRLNDPNFDITSNATAASQLSTNPLYAALASGYYWRYIKPKLNPSCDNDDVYWVSVYVNGWAKQAKPYYPNKEREPNHMKERVEKLAITKKALGL